MVIKHQTFKSITLLAIAFTISASAIISYLWSFGGLFSGPFLTGAGLFLLGAANKFTQDIYYSVPEQNSEFKKALKYNSYFAKAITAAYLLTGILVIAADRMEFTNNVRTILTAVIIWMFSMCAVALYFSGRQRTNLIKTYGIRQ